MKHRVGDSCPSHPIPSPALLCPRAWAVGTSQPAPELLLHVAAHAAQHGPPWPRGQALLSRDGYKTQGDGLHPHVQHLGDLGATSGRAAIPTALGAPRACCSCPQAGDSDTPNASPSPEPRGQGRATLDARPQANLAPAQDGCAGANTSKHNGKPQLKITTKRIP